MIAEPRNFGPARAQIVGSQATISEVNAGLVAIYKDGPAFEVIAVDMSGSVRQDWAAILLKRPIRFRSITGPAAREVEWRGMVRQLGSMLDPTRRPHAVAAIEVRPGK